MAPIIQILAWKTASPILEAGFILGTRDFGAEVFVGREVLVGRKVIVGSEVFVGLPPSGSV